MQQSYHAPMNASNTTQSGYMGSRMVTTTLPSVLSTYITPAFGSHVIEYRSLLSNQVTNGVSNNYAWATRKLDLMSEINVYGTTVVSSSFYDVGIDNMQYAIFMLKPSLRNFDGSDTSGKFRYWLKDVASDSNFADIQYGSSHSFGASSTNGVRPRFLID